MNPLRPFLGRSVRSALTALAIAGLAPRPIPAVAQPPPEVISSSPLADAPVTGQSTVTLYDGALGGTPDTQGFTYLTNPLFNPSATQTFANGVTTLDTTPSTGEAAGYFANSTLYPALDRTAGYSLLFTAQVVTETHANNDRAGFSVIVLSSDKMGIELGFWTNEVWAQEGGTTNLFTHAEGQAFNTTTGFITYTLTILGNNYALSADGAPVLSGSVRDYTAFVGFPDPYQTPNLIFLGDDTSSAQATIRLSFIRITAPLFSLYLPLISRDAAGGP